MTIALPGPIAAYFTADREKDADQVARLFGETATVTDERRTHVGRAAIRQWKAGSAAKYSYTVEPFAIAHQAGRTIVTAQLAGDFPGSPVDLRYAFTLAGEEIAGLEITA